MASRATSRPVIMSLKTGQQTHIDHGLKTVTDADDQFSGGDKFFQVGFQFIFQAGGQKDSGPVIVAPAETAVEGQEVIIL